MYSKIKKLALVITLAFSLSSVGTFAATGDISTSATGGVQFAMKEVNVVDGKTLKVSFTKDLLEDTSTFEFLLTPKMDDTKEIALTGIILSAPNELTLNTSEDLKVNEEYNLVVIFVSDKETNIIENGVDGMVTFKVPDNTVTTSTDVTPIDVVPTDVTPMNAAPTDVTPMNAAPTDVTLVNDGVTTENAAANVNPTEVKTGPQEMIVVILAMMLGLGLMYTRRKKA